MNSINVRIIQIQELQDSVKKELGEKANREGLYHMAIHSRLKKLFREKAKEFAKTLYQNGLKGDILAINCFTKVDGWYVAPIEFE